MFRRSSSPGGYKYLVSKGGDRCEAGSYGLYTTQDGGLLFYVYDGFHWTRPPDSDPSVWDGRWHHAAGTFDGGAVRLFPDGREIGSSEAHADIGYDLPSADASIGAYRASCSLLFEGDIDGVRSGRGRSRSHLEEGAGAPASVAPVSLGAVRRAARVSAVRASSATEEPGDLFAPARAAGIPRLASRRRSLSGGLTST